MSYDDDKRELLKLKQGIITESETIKEEPPAADKAHYEVKGFGKKISNFFYLYKWHVIIIAFFAAVAIFLIYTTVTKERGDLRVLLFAEDSDVSSSLYYKNYDFELALEKYTPDFDENGYTHVETFYINLSEEQDPNYYAMNQTKIFSEVNLGVAQIFIGDRSSLSLIIGEQDEGTAYEDLSALYPDDPNVVDKYYYHVKGSRFEKAAMYIDTCPDDLYIVVKNSEFEGYRGYNDEMAENHRRALEVFDNIVKDLAAVPEETQK